jgi:superfamily II DNA or RNA helicase
MGRPVLTLRPYQQYALDCLRASLGNGSRSPILVCPTGSGKTAIATEIVRGAVGKGKRVVFVANRKQLVMQASAAFQRSGIRHGIVMAGHDMHLLEGVQVASEQTLKSRLGKGRLMPSADLLIVDEAHMSVAAGVKELVESFGDIPRIGLTAPPCRGDGRGLGELYDDLVLGPSVSELMEQGYLSKARYFAPSKPDLEGVKIVRGDYDETQLAERMNATIIAGDVVTNWLRLAADRKTIVFAVNVAHSMALCEQFKAAGVAAEHLDGGHDDDAREGVLRRFRSGDTRVLCNCMLFTYGFDEPSASCVILARPTKLISMYLQTVGRALRTFDGKSDCLVMDHAGIVDELGFVDDPIEWSLDAKQKAARMATASGTAMATERAQMTCHKCKHVFRSARYCPGCGAEVVRHRKSEIEHSEADLLEMDREKNRKEWPIEQRERFYRELLGYADQKGKNRGMAYHKYYEKFGRYPIWGKDHQSLPPSLETMNWIKSRNIAFAKSRKAA